MSAQQPVTPSAPVLARASVRLSIGAIVSAVVGWVAFVLAIVLGDHFTRADPSSAVLLLLWMALGGVALAVWAAATVTAGLAWSRSRRERVPGASTMAVVMVLVVPCTWAAEWALLVLWFGYEVFSGPWYLL